MTFDISETLAPKSDQLDAVDLLGGPRTFTVVDVIKGDGEQPVQIRLADFPRVWRPGKSMRRVLAHCWGTDAAQWKGRRVTLYCDEAVMFGGETVGGTRISHLSHIDRRKSIPLLIKRGKSAAFTVEPLAAESPVDVLRREWRTATPDRRAEIEAEIAAQVNGTPAAEPNPEDTAAVED